ncbi:MAG TPA: DMT family transporter [Hypericibacter adhaerens]|uniref:DMT family transporter n=1 Tax=Hypericibacter adhaerens TaxID=2602016 RepID=UPI002C871BD9|nr:DMT family transporter [Hypericibacter adhaerens]HWA42439.1 DMT family transporter [Hypericibacter adhaerens]
MPYMLFAFIAGAALSLQALINARLAAGLGGALWAAAVSFFVGGAGLLGVQLATRATWPAMERAAAIPYWVWCGGFLGAVFVASVIASVPRLGNTSVFGLVIFGQLAASLLLDHFGVLATNPHPVNAVRLIGAALVLGGAVMVLKG